MNKFAYTKEININYVNINIKVKIWKKNHKI